MTLRKLALAAFTVSVLATSFALLGADPVAAPSGSCTGAGCQIFGK